MNAWVFRHLDELQRIYAEPAPDLPTVAPVPDGPPAAAAGRAPAPDRPAAEPASSGPGAKAPGTALPGTSGEADPFADGEAPEDTAGGPRPGSVIRHETPDGPDVILIPRGRRARSGSGPTRL